MKVPVLTIRLNIYCVEKAVNKENLEQTMLELSGIRTGMNLAYLITDKYKKNSRRIHLQQEH